MPEIYFPVSVTSASGMPSPTIVAHDSCGAVNTGNVGAKDKLSKCIMPLAPAMPMPAAITAATE